MINMLSWHVEVHQPGVAHASKLMSRHNLSAVDAIALMEEHADKALVLRGGEDAPPEDHELMTAFQKRTGKRLVRM